MTRATGIGNIHLLQDDITRVEADVIVNAANTHLKGGGGVDGAIHRVGGPSILEECGRIGRCPTGSAVVTRAGNLPAKYVIHAVAPVWWGGGAGEPSRLRGAYHRSLELADEVGARRVAFPSLGTGAYGYPVREAARIALGTTAEYVRADSSIDTVLFVLFSEADLSIYSRVLDEMRKGTSPERE